MTVTLAQYAAILQRSASGASGTAAAAIRATSQQVEAHARATAPLPSGLTVTFPDETSSVIGAPKPLGVWQDPMQGVWAAPPPSPAIVPGAAQVAGQLAADITVIRKGARYHWYGVAYAGGRAVARRVARQPRPEQDQRRLQSRAAMELAETLGRMIASGLSGGA